MPGASALGSEFDFLSIPSPLMGSSSQKILIVGPSWVGDMVMAQSLFRTLRQHHLNAHIAVLAPAWTKPLLQRMPEVSQALAMPLGHGDIGLGVRYRLGRQLRSENFDWAIVLPGSLKSALVPFWAKIPRRTGYFGELRWGLLNDIRRLDEAELPMTVQRFVALGLAKGELVPDTFPRPALVVNDESVHTALSTHGLNTDRPVLVLCPGAEYGPAKRWPPDYFANVARAKLNQGWQVWVMGSQRDRKIGEEIVTLAPGSINLAGKTALAQAIDLLSLAQAVVTNDSGLMHIAAALERRTIAVYGSSDPGFTPPLSERAQVLRIEIDCSPCFKRECPFGHYRCLRELTPDRVLQTLASCKNSASET